MFVDKDHKLQPVCQKFFCAALNLSQRRLLTIAKQIQSGDGIRENRGGDRTSKKYANKEKSVIEFIGNLKATESHYNRKKSVRMYLPSELNVSRLFNMYNSTVDNTLQVKKTFFNNIFATKFNIGFGTPATDVCSFCYQIKNQLKTAESEEEKSHINMKFKLHRTSAKQFHIMMNEKPKSCISFCFDLQQVQVLPKVPIQEAFYSTQLALYNFCVTDLETLNPVFYSWLETQAGRGSTEISSALYNFLIKLTWPEDCSSLRLFCDGCSGQNKNSIVVSMLMFWLYHMAPAILNSILLVFPVRGHSFLPADRVFGRIEKISKKRTEILKKEDYWNIFGEVGEVKCLGKDWELFKWKSLADCFKKVENIRDAKRIFIKKSSQGKITIRIEPYYKNEIGAEVSLLKKGKSFQSMSLQKVVLGRKLKDKKLKDIENLLDKSYSKLDANNVKISWRTLGNLEWYRELIDNQQNDPGQQEVEEGEEQEHCDCTEDDDRLHV